MPGDSDFSLLCACPQVTTKVAVSIDFRVINIFQ